MVACVRVCESTEFLPLPLLIEVWGEKFRKLNKFRHKSRLNKLKHLDGSKTTHSCTHHNHILGSDTFGLFGLPKCLVLVSLQPIVVMLRFFPWLDGYKLLLSILSLLDPFQKFILTCMRHILPRKMIEKTNISPLDTILNWFHLCAYKSFLNYFICVLRPLLLLNYTDHYCQLEYFTYDSQNQHIKCQKFDLMLGSNVK